MDTTKQYILMCEKANEIQELHTNNNLETGNVYVSKYYFDYKVLNDNDIAEVYYDDGYNCGTRKYKYYCWLPRQDQLQEMINSKTAIKVSDFFWFVVGVGRIDDRHMEIMEDADMDKINKFSLDQLWLMFVMKVKYNKVWNGKDWKKNGK